MTEMPHLLHGLQREQESKFGTQILPNGVRFRLWAPLAKSVSLKLYDLGLVVAMTALARGWYEVEVEEARAGMRYRFVLENGEEVRQWVLRHKAGEMDALRAREPAALEYHDRASSGRA